MARVRNKSDSALIALDRLRAVLHNDRMEAAIMAEDRGHALCADDMEMVLIPVHVTVGQTK